MTEVAIPVGNTVICDSCNDDYTDSDALGGMVCGSWAICPMCKPTWMSRGIPKRSKITLPSVPWQTFREFIIAYRGPDAAIKIIPKEGNAP